MTDKSVLALARRAIIGIYFPPIPWPMTNCEKTKLLPVIAVLITNDVTNEDLLVTEIIEIGSLTLWEGKARRWSQKQILRVRRDG